MHRPDESVKDGFSKEGSSWSSATRLLLSPELSDLLAKMLQKRL